MSIRLLKAVSACDPGERLFPQDLTSSASVSMVVGGEMRARVVADCWPPHVSGLVLPVALGSSS